MSSRKKYHVHGYTGSGRKLSVYMSDVLQDAVKRAKSIARSSRLEATILKLSEDGRSYEKYMMVQPIINYRTGGIRRLAISRKKPNTRVEDYEPDDVLSFHARNQVCRGK